MNVTHERLTKEEAAKPWVAEALEADEIEREAVAKILDEKHGKKRVVHDPSNPEASAAAVANGYAVVYGGSHSSAAWENIRDLTPVRTAPETFKDVGVDFSADGDDISIPEEKWTKEMRVIVAWAKHLHLVAWGYPCSVDWVLDPRGYAACYGSGVLLLNKQRLGNAWIRAAASSEDGFKALLDLLIHEFAHKASDSHYSESFYKACTRIGAAFAIHLAGSDLKALEVAGAMGLLDVVRGNERRSA